MMVLVKSILRPLSVTERALRNRLKKMERLVERFNRKVKMAAGGQKATKRKLLGL